MAQPETMEELLLSLQNQQAVSANKVIGTLATRTMDNLPTGQKAIARQALQAHLAAAISLDQQVPGAPVTLQAQTDQYYLEADKDGIFTSLAAHIVTVATRTR
jgi:hypothetical protein